MPGHPDAAWRRRRCRAFTLVELLVVVSIIALLLSILLPALGKARRSARQVKNGAQIRGIHQGMLNHATSNNGLLPGVASTSDYVAATMTQDATDLSTAASRSLIADDLVASDMFYSPGESEDGKRRYRDEANTNEDDPGNLASPFNVPFARRHTSYGMVMGGNGTTDDRRFFFDQTRKKLSAGTNNPLPSINFTTAADELAPYFANAWTDRATAITPVLADRVPFGSGATSSGMGQSIWSVKGEPWEGSIVWADNHVDYIADQADVEWEIDGYTGLGLIPPEWADPVNLPFNGSVFIWQ